MSKTLLEMTEASTFFFAWNSYNRCCLSTKSISFRKRKWVECVLRAIRRCVVFGKFHDGLHITFNCEKDVKVFCHTRKYLSWSHGWLGAHMYCCDFTSSLCIYKIRIIPHVCKYVHDSSRTKSQNHTIFCESNSHAVHWRISAWWNYGILQSICSHGKSISSRCNYRVLHGSWNMEICFLYSEMESKPL